MITNTPPLNPALLREQFPALQLEVNGKTAVYLDGPAGTQVPQRVIDAISHVLSVGISNTGGAFAPSEYSRTIIAGARAAMADFVNARRPEEISFGQSMTSNTLNFSLALNKTWQAGDEIIVTRLDHEGNVSPWLLAAAQRGVTVRWLDLHPEDATLALETLPDLLNERTRLIAITYASNAVGSITNMQKVVEMAHAAGALVFIDAVHYSPHGLIDVQALDCDFLVCSSYKFFGPHMGILYGKYEIMAELEAYKIRPASAEPPTKWEAGTPNIECLAGITAAVDYIASLAGSEGSRRERLVRAMGLSREYEMSLSERFSRGATAGPGLRVFGITDIERLDERCPTFAVRLDGHDPEELHQKLGARGIFTWAGDYYAIEAIKRLGYADKGGFLRIGFVHYNTPAEVDAVLNALADLANG
jgi:cysteine desulfurase family protein (TIGR01976 family)